MLAGGKLKRVVQIGIFLFLPCRLFASEQLIIPEMCVERAKEIGVFHNKSQTATTRDRLQISKAPWQVYDYKAMFEAYQATLTEVSSQMENYQSPLFKHLESCRTSERTCHGWFDTKNPLHVKIFCDPIISRATYDSVYPIKEARFNKCVNQSYDLISEDDLLSNPDLNYDKSCFDRVTLDEKSYLKNKSNKYLVELKYLEGWSQKFTKTSINIIKKSLIPEGVDYILQKVLEEFSDLSIGQNKANDHNTHYLSLDLIDTFKNCCENADPLTQSGQTSFKTLAHKLAEMNSEPTAEIGIVFQTRDLLSDLIFNEAEAQGWRDRIATNSPVDFNISEKVNYFEFLKRNPFFYQDKRTFTDFVADSKKHDRSEYFYRLPTEEDELKNDADWEQYKKKMGYKEYKPFETYSVRNDDEYNVINHFLFNPIYKQAYLGSIRDDQKKAEHERFESNKKDEYPKIIKGFLPYQFARTAQAKIIRELQKKTATHAGDMLGSFEKFSTWADQITCQKQETTYCAADQNKFRKVWQGKLYTLIITEAIPMEFAMEPTPRRFIYTTTMLKTINEKIKNVNDFCWAQAAPEKFKKKAGQFADLTKQLDEHMKSFFSIERFEEIMGQEEFYDTLEFNFNTHTSDCFTKGYVFGSTSLTPTMEGKKIVKTIYGGTTSVGIPIYINIEAKDDGLLFQKAYLPSNFRVQETAIQEIEMAIEERTTEEFQTLKKAFFYSEENQKEFLEESAFKRLLALVDYAIANPTKEVGLYICDLITQADITEYQYLKTLQIVQTIVLVSVSIFTIAFFPCLAPEVIMFYEAGAAIIMAGASLVTGYMEIKYYEKQSDLTGMAAITGNISGIDAMVLQEYYDESISSSKTSIGLSLGFLVLFGFRPIMQSVVKIKKWADAQYRLVHASRKRMLEDVLQRTPDEQLNSAKSGADGSIERIAESERFVINQRIKDFVTDYTKVTDDQFTAFKNAIETGRGRDFIFQTWGKELGKYLPVTPIAIRTPTQLLVPTANSMPTIISRLALATSKVANPYLFRFKMFVSKVWNYKKLKDPFEAEDWMAAMIQRAQLIKEKKGIIIFTEEEIAAYMSKMKFFKLGQDGKIYRILSPEKEKIMSHFLLNNVVDIDSYTARKYLEKFIHGNQLTLKDWELVQQHFNRKLHSIDDCKLFIKVLKFAKREYPFLKEQLKNLPELLNRREFIKKFVYKKRFDLIAKDINEFFGIARYTAYKNDVRLVDDMKAAFENAQKSGKSLDDLEGAIRKKYDSDFSFAKKIEEYESKKTYVSKFNEDAVVNSDPMFKQSLKELAKDEQALLSSYKKQFLDLEKKYNDLFHRKIMGNLKKGYDVVHTYGRALLRTQNAKQAEYECSLPGSNVTLEANRMYKKTAGAISLSTNFYGYWVNHSDEEKDWEWIGRFGYEMVAPLLVGQLQARYFTNQGGGPVYKTFREWLVGAGASSFEAGAYWGASELSWNKKNELADDFKKLIYESPDVKNTIETFFKDNPEIKDRIMAEFEKIKNVFDELELKNYRGTMVTSEMEDAFVRAGLIDNILYSDMELKNRELGEDYLYHELVESGYLDEDLYRDAVDNQDLENQIYELLGEIRYNSLFDEKEDELDLPLLDPMETGIDWPEIRTGSEAVDRALFNPIYDAAKTPIAYPKNLAVYWLLCKARSWPGNSNIIAAWALHLTYKAYMDSFKFYVREQMTGR